MQTVEPCPTCGGEVEIRRGEMVGGSQVLYICKSENMLFKVVLYYTNPVPVPASSSFSVSA